MLTLKQHVVNVTRLASLVGESDREQLRSLADLILKARENTYLCSTESAEAVRQGFIVQNRGLVLFCCSCDQYWPLPDMAKPGRVHCPYCDENFDVDVRDGVEAGKPCVTCMENWDADTRDSYDDDEDGQKEKDADRESHAEDCELESCNDEACPGCNYSSLDREAVSELADQLKLFDEKIEEDANGILTLRTELQLYQSQREWDDCFAWALQREPAKKK